MIPTFILIANPNTKRCELFTREYHAFWSSRSKAPTLVVISWSELIASLDRLDQLPAFGSPAIVRLESPGKNDDVTRLLLTIGGRLEFSPHPQDWSHAIFPKGRVVYPGMWYLGFQHVLQQLHVAFQQRPWLRVINNPLHCAELFDKTATAGRLYDAEIPVPPWLTIPDTVYQEVLTRSQPYYLKLNSGSNAMGIVVIQLHDGELIGTSSLVEIDNQFYNTRQLQYLTDSALFQATDFILAEGAIAQKAIPMAQIDSQNFDVRVVCVYGRPVACIFRLSSKPMTNLHFGGRRGEEAYCRSHIPKRLWLDALDHCSEVADLYDCAMVGIDLLFEQGYQQYYILEVNAFGDFFPGWVNPQGQSIHQLELAAIEQRFEWC